VTEVVVTGLGAVSCQGAGVRTLLTAMDAGRAASPTRLGDPSAHLRNPLIHAVPDPVPGTDEFGRAGALAVLAAVEALAQAGLAPAPAGARIGVSFGTTLGDGVAPVDGEPGFRVAAAVGRLLGRPGTNLSVSNACAASGFAVSMAADLIRAGEADVVVSGGADAYSRVGWACMDRLGALDPQRCRPFDIDRQGTVLGEGAGVLVLESAEHARARGAGVLARLGGDAWSCDAGHLTAPDDSGEQIVRATRAALGADMRAGAVVPHATGTAHNDRVESAVLRQVFGAALDEIPLFSLKPLVGHTGGASAALASVAAVGILQRGTVPANVAVDAQDPDCDVFLPQDGDTALTVPRVLVNAYAFGGNNSAIVWERA
jgi:3-oxoacyl-[acyl-carrier-protein] synthase II